MKLPFLKKQDKKPEFTDELYFAIDIGTEVVKTLMFRCSEMGVHILKSSRIFQQRHAMKSGVIKSLNTVIENCKLAYNELTDDLMPDQYPKKAVMGIAGEMIHGVSIVVDYDREDRASQEVDRKEQDNIFEQVKDNVLNEGKNELAKKYGIDLEDIEIIHVTVTGVDIGGMPVDTLLGFTGKKVKLNFYASFAPKTYLEALRKVAKELELELMGVVSQPFAMARVFSGASDRSFNGIFVDIGGGTTDVALVEQGNIVDTQIFAFGGRVFTKRISKSMNLDYRHAESRKLKYSNSELDDKISTKVKKSISSDVDLWVEGLRNALTMMEDVDQYPPFIYLCGGGAMLPDLRRSLIEYPWKQKLSFMRFPKVLLVTPDKLEMVIDKHQQLKDSMDITPAGLAKFAWDKIKYPDRHFSD